MQLYDMLMLAVVISGTMIGFHKGMAWQVASLASIFVSYWSAVRFRDLLAPQLAAAEPWNKFLAMLLIYLATSLLIWIAFRLVSGFIDRAKLKEFDRQLGALLGAAKGVLLCVIITLFAVSLLDDTQRQQIVYSRSGYYIAQLLNRSESVIPRELHELLDPYLHRLEEGLDGPAASPAGDESETLYPVQLAPAEHPWELPRHTSRLDRAQLSTEAGSYSQRGLDHTAEGQY